jgi:hypothetical protein
MWAHCARLGRRAASHATRRSFWCITRGVEIVQIESLHKQGYIFKHNEARARITSSNMAPGEVKQYSLEMADAEPRACLGRALASRRPVRIEYECHVLGLPWRGYIFNDPAYIQNATFIQDSEPLSSTP